MSELTLSLKNKKSAGTTGKTNTDNSYSNLIKPLISTGRGPQSTKNNANTTGDGNFAVRSYTQRVGAAPNPASTNASTRYSNNPQIHHFSKNQIIK